MKNLKALFDCCLHEVQTAGIKAGPIISVRQNSRAKNRWGQTQLINGGFVIEINTELLQDSVSDLATKNTIIHEILHTVDGCMNHGDKWQWCAARMNKYGYNIKRTTSAAEKGIEQTYKYVVKCQGCGATAKYNRAGKVIQHPENYRCGKCGGELKVLI